jgi:hypothetical protein
METAWLGKSVAGEAQRLCSDSEIGEAANNACCLSLDDA